MLLSPEELLDDNPHCRLCEQWGTYPGSGGTIRYPVSFTSKVFAVISSSSLNFNATDINNLAYWTTTDTNIGNNWKTSGWYLAMGK